MSYDLLDGKLVPLVGLRRYHDKRTFEDATSSLPKQEEREHPAGEPVMAAHR